MENFDKNKIKVLDIGCGTGRHMFALRKMGYKVEERSLSIDEIVEAYKKGVLNEIFGTGTAATISLIKELKYKDFAMTFDVDKWTIAPEVKRRMDAIKYGLEPDTHDWLFKI